MEPDAKRQKIEGGTASTSRNDADFDIQVTDANMSSSDDPSSGLNSVSSVCWQGEKHVRRDQERVQFRRSCCKADCWAKIFDVFAESKASVLISLTTSLLFGGMLASHGQKFIDPATVRPPVDKGRAAVVVWKGQVANETRRQLVDLRVELLLSH